MIFKRDGKFKATGFDNLQSPAATYVTASIQETDDSTLRQRLRHGPPEQTWATSYAINKYDGHRITEAIRTGDAILAGDSSYKEETGQIAGAYGFTTDVYRDDPCHP